MLYYDRTKQSQKVDLMAQESTVSFDFFKLNSYDFWTQISFLKKKKEDVLKSIVLKKLIHQEEINAKKIKIFNDQHELENANNINTGLLDKHT